MWAAAGLATTASSVASPAASPAPTVICEAGRVIVLIMRSTPECRLKCRNGIGLNWWMTATLHCKPEGAVERGQLVRAKTARLSLTEAHPCHSDPILDFVVERHRVTSKTQAGGKRLQPFSCFVVNELARFDLYPGLQKTLPARHPFELTPDS